ncbi:transposase [Komagataeibacter intermedius AF2]|uniref:Transposase n=1 Tax=Komagataeibacter intermedius AF2 TaxID=1458464 RepID=A0A0N1F938_9PROT|nr:transposase [Komagataeibacter intermedius AF2]
MRKSTLNSVTHHQCLQSTASPVRYAWMKPLQKTLRTEGNSPGQAHKLPLTPATLDNLPTIPLRVVADKGYASNAFRERIWDMGARSAIPAKRRDGSVACPKWAYRCRHLVENLWARLKEWRAVATRYEKTATSFLAVIHIAAAADWIKPEQALPLVLKSRHVVAQSIAAAHAIQQHVQCSRNWSGSDLFFK